MAITALDIRKQEFKRVMRGYSPLEVKRFLELVALEVETLTKVKKELSERIKELEARIKKYEDAENLLRDTLTTAHQTASRIKEEARKEAEEILQETKERVEREYHRTFQDLENLKDQKKAFIADFKNLLQSYLKALEYQREGEEKGP